MQTTAEYTSTLKRVCYIIRKHNHTQIINQRILDSVNDSFTFMGHWWLPPETDETSDTTLGVNCPHDKFLYQLACNLELWH